MLLMPPMPRSSPAVRHWLSRAVIGLNLCPFAKSVYVKDQVRYVVSHGHGVRGRGVR